MQLLKPGVEARERLTGRLGEVVRADVKRPGTNAALQTLGIEDELAGERLALDKHGAIVAVNAAKHDAVIPGLADGEHCFLSSSGGWDGRSIAWRVVRGVHRDKRSLRRALLS